MYSCSHIYINTDSKFTALDCIPDVPFTPVDENQVIPEMVKMAKNVATLREMRIYVRVAEKLKLLVERAKDFIQWIAIETPTIVNELKLKDCDRTITMEISPMNSVKIRGDIKEEFRGTMDFVQTVNSYCKQMIVALKDHPNFNAAMIIEVDDEIPWNFHEYEEVSRGSVTLFFSPGVGVILNKSFN